MFCFVLFEIKVEIVLGEPLALFLLLPSPPPHCGIGVMG